MPGKKIALAVLLVGLASCWVVAQNAPAMQITKGPILESVGDTTAVIAWSTNAPGSTVLKYGTDPSRLDQMAEAKWGGETHRVHLTSLKPNTTYYFQVESGQAQGTGTGALSKVDSFQTVAQGAPPKHYPPVK